MYETLLRPHEVNTIPPLTPVCGLVEKLRASERKREEKR
jgi:tRNA (adenine57-N1/adenine58-N1)-methyltransferase catalytic subunit